VKSFKIDLFISDEYFVEKLSLEVFAFSYDGLLSQERIKKKIKKISFLYI
jgi:hypothetical protein